MTSRLSVFCLAIAVAATFTACSSSNSAVPQAKNRDATAKGQQVAQLSGMAGQAVSVTPNSMNFANRLSAPQSFESNQNFNGIQTAQSSDPLCAIVDPTNTSPNLSPTRGGTKSATFAVTPEGAGICTITVTDKKGNSATVQVTVVSRAVSTLAGNIGSPGGLDGIGSTAKFYGPEGIAVGQDGIAYVADGGLSSMFGGCGCSGSIRSVSSNGTVVTLAGIFQSAGSTDGNASQAQFNQPYGVAVDANGALYVADTFSHTIREISPSGIVSTIAGAAGQHGFVDGIGTAARFNFPRGIAVDAYGKLYVADSSNHAIRRLEYSTAGWSVSTLAGSATSPGSADGTGSSAQFRFPWGITVDNAGIVYATDFTNENVRKITPTGSVTTLAGDTGVLGYVDGTGSSAQFGSPEGITVGPNDTLYVAEFRNDTIRQVTSSGIVTTLTGKVLTTGSVDGALDAALFNHPESIAIDNRGALYVTDFLNETVRLIR